MGEYNVDKYQALQYFWSGFGLSAYDETSVPEETPLPYVTYESSVDEFNTPVALTASLWYRSSSWKSITEKCKEIESYIGKGGVMIPYDEGVMWVCKASPWAQRLPDSNDNMIRRIVLNIQVEYIS